MSVFAIISPMASNPKLETKIQELYPKDYYKLFENQWMVCSGGTAQELSEKLEINKEEGNTGPAIVFSVASYWGRANPNIWEWIKVNWTKTCD